MTAGHVERPWLRHYPPGVRPTLDYPQQPLYALLDISAADYPDQPATIFMGAQLTYREIKRQADAFASALVGLGVRPGDRVAVMLPNCPQAVIAFYGTLKAGAVVVMTNPLYVERELEHQMADSGAETIVCLDFLYRRVDRVRAKTGLKRIIVTSIADYLPIPIKWLYPFKAKREGYELNVPQAPGVFRFKPLIDANREKPLPSVVIKSDGVAVLQYTGGTTGLSKGAMLSHHNLVANALQTREWLAALGPLERARDKVLAVMPFFHVYGLTVCLNLAVSQAGTMILVPKLDLEQILATISKYKPTLFPGAPTLYIKLLAHPKLGQSDLRSIRACISGSAPLPVEVQKQFESVTGGKLVEGYGLTEASPVTHSNPLAGKRVIGSIGIPFPDTEVSIADLETGERDLPIGAEGELCIRGPQVMMGYWNRPEESAQTVRDGWLYTGDVAKLDEDGFAYIVDRKKEMIISSGYNIYPREVEEVLFQHAAVAEAAAIGLPDPVRGEIVKVFVVLKAGASSTPEEIIAHCREHLAKYKIPSRVEFRTELPKTLIGKVLRRALKEEEMARAKDPAVAGT